MSTTTVDATYELIERSRLHESPLNPRHTYDPAKLAELAASIKAKGIISPLLLRPNAKGYEIAAGHRRYRAAAIADLGILPCIVRPMDDAEFVEVLNIENLQREDLTPLEEAEGYKLLMTKASYSVERIAERVGKSEKYVYDRVKLLQLVPEAKKLLVAGTITAGHAILLARLKADDQKRAIALDEDGRGRGGLLDYENVLEDPDGKEPLTEPVKAVTVRELEGWIAEHVRFKPTEADPFLLPHTAAAVSTAVQTKKKVVEITHDSYIQDDAREGKTIREGFWQRADGKDKSKTCERSVIGVIVVGPGQGDSFEVCVDRERCTVHWAKEIKARAARAATPKRTGAQNIARANNDDRWKREQEKRNREEKRSAAALPAIFKELAEKIKKAAAGVKGPLGQLLLDVRDQGEAADYMPLGTSAEDLVRFLAFDALSDRPDTWAGLKKFTTDCKPFGVNVQKHLADVDKAAKAAAEEAKREAGAKAGDQAHPKKASTKKAKK